LETEQEFRARAVDFFSRLLEQFRIVERGIKRAEQINKKAVIPAINELRYAARQLFNAQRLFAKDPLNRSERHIIGKRLIIAEQYFLNAEHDICDAVVGFYHQLIARLDAEFGISTITVYFHEYPKLRELRARCLELIADAREDYGRRKEIYDTLRNDAFPEFYAYHQALLDAELTATAQRDKEKKTLDRALAKKKFSDRLSIALAIVAIIQAYYYYYHPLVP